MKCLCIDSDTLLLSDIPSCGLSIFTNLLYMVESRIPSTLQVKQAVNVWMSCSFVSLFYPIPYSAADRRVCHDLFKKKQGDIGSSSSKTNREFF